MSWLRCSACKRDIGFGAVHWVCSVSTCNRRNTDYKFCSVACWDSHVATLRHRDAWAVEARAPSREAWAREQQEAAAQPAAAATPAPAPTHAPAPRPTTGPATEAPRRVIATPGAGSAPAPTAAQLNLAEAERDILIVVSKLKKYIKDRSGMNTSDSVAEVLSDHVRAICDDAIRAAGGDGRKTVLDRDVPRVRR
ncbi:MAG TPA: hypothetical protein VM734_13925 [Kofleriaceae bacterium]|jgi:hypothetical protein|nr:hypothetical protein [Kofleriaceae bacterium]